MMNIFKKFISRGNTNRKEPLNLKQCKEKRKEIKLKQKPEMGIQELWGNIKWSSKCITGIPEDE